MSVITGVTHRERADPEFRRAAAQRSRSQRHAGLGARHQRHQPRRDRHAGDRAAGAARRPESLSGLLRLRDVGLPAGEPERGEADRSDSRAGLSGLGRQRAIRRRQRDHQVAARDAGHHRGRRRSAASTAPTAVMPARCGTSAARTRRRSTIAGRSRSPPAAIRRTPMSRPTGTVPVRSARGLRGPRASYPPFTNAGTAQPKIDGRVDYDYADGGKLSFSGGASGTDGIMHTGIGPFDINSGSVMGYAKANYDEEGLPRGVLHQHPQRRRRQSPDQRRPGARRSPSTSTPGPTTSRPRTSRPLPPSTWSRTAGTCGSTSPSCRSRRPRTIAGVRRLRAGRDLSFEAVQADRRRAAGPLRLHRTISWSHRGRRS